jgi:hypothetical protein
VTPPIAADSDVPFGSEQVTESPSTSLTESVPLAFENVSSAEVFVKVSVTDDPKVGASSTAAMFTVIVSAVTSLPEPVFVLNETV